MASRAGLSGGLAGFCPDTSKSSPRRHIAAYSLVIVAFKLASGCNSTARAQHNTEAGCSGAAAPSIKSATQQDDVLLDVVGPFWALYTKAQCSHNAATMRSAVIIAPSCWDLPDCLLLGACQILDQARNYRCRTISSSAECLDLIQASRQIALKDDALRMICVLDFEPAARSAVVRGHTPASLLPACKTAQLGRRKGVLAVHNTASRTSLIGIDLGTSNSTIACLRDGKAVIVPAADGGRFTPSVVALSQVSAALSAPQAGRFFLRTVPNKYRDTGSICLAAQM